MTTLPLAQPGPFPATTQDAALPLLGSRKIWWAALLCVGYWFATPYYLPWTAADEASADTRAIAAQGSLSREAAVPLLAMLCMYMLWRSAPTPKLRGHLSMAAVLYVMVMVSSIAWSPLPEITFRRLVVFLFDIFIVVAIARVYSMLDLAKICFFICGLAGLLAFFVDTVITKSFAPFDPTYRMMGIMNSNSQGENLTVCIFCGFTLMLLYSRWTKWIVPSLFAAAVLQFLTRSRTSTICCLGLSFFFIHHLLKKKHRLQARISLVLIVLALILPILVARGDAADVIQQGFMMGRKDTENTASLSNRLPLWQEVLEYTGKRPLLGYGYNTFWTSDTIDVISAHQKWPVPNAHNVYLDQYLSAGVPGVLLFAFIFWGAIIVTWRRYIRQRAAESLLPALILTWLFFTSLTESVQLDPFFPTTIAYVCVAKAMMPLHISEPRPAPAPLIKFVTRIRKPRTLRINAADPPR